MGHGECIVRPRLVVFQNFREEVEVLSRHAWFNASSGRNHRGKTRYIQDPHELVGTWSCSATGVNYCNGRLLELFKDSGWRYEFSVVKREAVVFVVAEEQQSRRLLLWRLRS